MRWAFVILDWPAMRVCLTLFPVSELLHTGRCVVRISRLLQPGALGIWLHRHRLSRFPPSASIIPRLHRYMEFPD